MKVTIGPYRNWVGPYQIAEKILFWMDKDEDRRVHKLGTWLAENSKGDDSWITKLCTWIHSKQDRKIKVKIHNYDVWNMDGTLSLIILPMLIELKRVQHGAPSVEDEDVPEELRSTSAPAKENEWDTDENHSKRWDWVLDEMIWSFTQKNMEDDEAPYRTGTSHIMFQAVDKDGNKIGEPHEIGKSPEGTDEATMFEMVKGQDDTSQTDWDGLKAHWARIQNGTRLFGKYYSNLWD